MYFIFLQCSRTYELILEVYDNKTQSASFILSIISSSDFGMSLNAWICFPTSCNFSKWTGKTFIGSIVAKVIVSKSKGQQDAEDIFEGGSFEDTLNFMPLRALSNMSGGQLPEEMMYAIIDVCNYNFIKAFRKLRGK